MLGYAPIRWPIFRALSSRAPMYAYLYKQQKVARKKAGEDVEISGSLALQGPVNSVMYRRLYVRKSAGGFSRHEN